MRRATTLDWVAAAVLAVVVAGAAACGLAGCRDGGPDRARGTGDDRDGLDDPKVPRDAVRATVIRVVDGDTLVADLRGRAERVRLIGVDAPETAGVGASETLGVDAPETPGVDASRTAGVDASGTAARSECHGRRATIALRRLAGRRTALRLAYDREPRDRYGRRLAYAWTADGAFLNAALVRGGHARPMTVAPNDRYAALFHAAGRRARAARTGMWSRCESQTLRGK
jgi:endonuclease YncB( thermonuclease family)